MSDDPTPAATAPASTRLVSLDAYRGFVMLAMVSHSFGLPKVARELTERGDQQAAFWQTLAYQFDHVPWPGCVFWDLIQPSFMFLVGTAMAFSCASRRAKGQSYGRMALHAAWRSIALILLGVFLRTRSDPDPATGLWPMTNFTFEDVVSQIGLGYFFLFLLWGRSQVVLLGVAALILTGYWSLFASYPLPPEGFDYTSVGVPADWEYHLPGFQAHWDKNTNAATAFDQWFLNLFPRSEKYVFNAGGYQTLSFIPSLATMIFGLMAGQMLQADRKQREKFGLLLLAGLAGLVIGYLLHVGGICPVVKRIWTPSWTIYSTGWTCLMLAAFYGIIELGNLRAWAFPLVVVGANSIAIYCLDKLTYGWIVKRLKTHLGPDIFTLWGRLDPAYSPLVESLIVMTILWLILYWMYRRKIFLKI